MQASLSDVEDQNSPSELDIDPTTHPSYIKVGAVPEVYRPYRIIFENDGLVDMLGVKTFGVNAKDGDNPIGYFGTGLKYAIAIILRHEGKFTIFRGIERYDFTVRPTQSRGKSFGLIYCNDEPLSFTTDLGKNWKEWQALRELYCNTVDERGQVIVQEQEPQTERTKTKMIVTGEHWGRIWADERGSFILDTKPLATSEWMDVHPGETKHIYYKGIRAYTAERPFMYTYNIKTELTLTEDRTIAWEWQAKDRIYRGLLLLTNHEILRSLFRIAKKDDKDLEEFHFSYPQGYEISKEAASVIKELHAAKELGSQRGLGYYYEREVLHDMDAEDIEFSAGEVDTIDRVNDILKASGITPYFQQMVVTEQLHAGTPYYVKTKPYGIGFKLYQGALVLEGTPEAKTLFIPRATVMQGVEETLMALIEAMVAEAYDFKDEMRTLFVKQLIASYHQKRN